MAQAQIDGKRRDASPAPHILDRQPPFDLSAEHGLLGSLLLKPDSCDDVTLVLRESDFYDEANRKLFRHMMQLHDASNPPVILRQLAVRHIWQKSDAQFPMLPTLSITLISYARSLPIAH